LEAVTVGVDVVATSKKMMKLLLGVQLVAVISFVASGLAAAFFGVIDPYVVAVGTTFDVDVLPGVRAEGGGGAVIPFGLVP